MNLLHAVRPPQGLGEITKSLTTNVGSEYESVSFCHSCSKD